MATAESENSQGEIDLAYVKSVTREVNSYGFEDCVTPLITWSINVKEHLEGRPKDSSFALDHPQFPTNDARYVARMTLVHLPTKCNLTLVVKKSEPEVPVEPFPLFICKMYDGAAVPLQPKIYLPQNSFDCSATTTRLLFPFPANISKELIVIEIHQVSWKRTGSRSPLGETAVGKIERFREDIERVGNNERYLMSPLMTFDTDIEGSSMKQFMMVRFWYKDHKAHRSINRMKWTLHLLNHEGQRDQEFEVFVTFFNQNKEKMKMRKVEDYEVEDLLVKFEWEPEVTGGQKSIVVVKDMKNYIDDEDTLYYKIRVSLVPSKSPRLSDFID